MYVKAKELIGKRVQKVESTKRALVVDVEEGLVAGYTTLVFEPYYKGMYSDRDIDSMLVDGKHLHQTH